MPLSEELISQFVKATNDDKKSAGSDKESTVYGTIVEYNNSKYVRIDGSELLTPISSTANVKNEERVTVMIKNHMATVTGNLSSPSARSGDVDDVYDKISDFEVVIADAVHTKELEAELAIVDELLAKKANIADLEANYLTSTNADIKYANIDFSNIGSAAMEYFYATSGLVEDVTIDNGTITGNLVGVTIKGDLIEGNTVVADKLVIKGTDGLYYKLNTDGMKIEAKQTDYNSLNGSIITAKSITATKISVEDLVAFGATIGGFHITESSIYSGVKKSVNNTTRGIYLDKNGQVAFGDAINYVKYYQDTDGTYKLSIKADQLYLSSGDNVGDVLIDVLSDIDNLESRVIEAGKNNIYLQFKRPTGSFTTGDTWIKHQKSLTWGEVKTATWGDKKAFLWGELGNSNEPKTYVWNGSGWKLTVDYNVVKDNATQILQTSEKIESKADRTEVNLVNERVTKMSTTVTQTAEALESKAEKSDVEELSTTVTQTAEALELKANKGDPATSLETSTVSVTADGVNIKTGGTFTVESGNFELDDQGNMTAQNAYLSGYVYVNGSEALSAKNIYVGSTAPSNPVNGMIWIKPDTSTSAQTAFSKTIPWTGRYNLINNVRTGTLTGSKTTAVGSTYLYNIRIPIYIGASSKNGTTGAVLHFDIAKSTSGDPVLQLAENVTIDTHGQGNRVIEFEVYGDTWIGNVNTLYFSLYTTALSGYYAYNVLNSSDQSAAITVTCTSYSSSGATGWAECSVYCYS